MKSEESKYFMVVTADNWLEVWAIGFIIYQEK